MKITSFKVVPVNVPLKAPIRWAWGIRTGVTRNIIFLQTDEGIEGIGETMGGAGIYNLIQDMGKKLIGRDPSHYEPILAQFQLVPYFSGYNGLAALGGLEMAMWDLVGKGRGCPVYELLGGAVRTEIQHSAYVFMRYRSGDQGGETTPAQIAEWCRDLMRESGFSVLKVKAGVMPPEHDVAILQALRAEFGDKVKLRVDPNGVWTPETTLRLRNAFLELGLEYLEDPTWGLEPMARLRQEIPIPFATNMCVVDFEHIPTALKLGAVDVILADAHKWGGLWATKKLGVICEAFQLGLSLHSGCELGISTVANLHLGACIPKMTYAIDTHYMHLQDDIIEGGLLTFRNGALKVPDGPGLGVALDPDRFERYAELHRKEGHLGSVGDPMNPSFVPAKQQW